MNGAIVMTKELAIKLLTSGDVYLTLQAIVAGKTLYTAK